MMTMMTHMYIIYNKRNQVNLINLYATIFYSISMIIFKNVQVYSILQFLYTNHIASVLKTNFTMACEEVVDSNYCRITDETRQSTVITVRQIRYNIVERPSPPASPLINDDIPQQPIISSTHIHTYVCNTYTKLYLHTRVYFARGLDAIVPYQQIHNHDIQILR